MASGCERHGHTVQGILTAKRDVDVVEADVNSQIGDDFLRRECPVGAGDLFARRMPFRSEASH